MLSRMSAVRRPMRFLPSRSVAFPFACFGSALCARTRAPAGARNPADTLLIAFVQTFFTSLNVSVPASLAEWVTVFPTVRIYVGIYKAACTLLFVILHDDFSAIPCLSTIASLLRLVWFYSQKDVPSYGGGHKGQRDCSARFLRCCKAERYDELQYKGYHLLARRCFCIDQIDSNLRIFLWRVSPILHFGHRPQPGIRASLEPHGKDQLFLFPPFPHLASQYFVVYSSQCYLRK